MLNPMGCCNDRHRFVLDKLECYQMIVHVPPNQTLGIAKCAGEVKITRYLFNWLILCSRGCSLGFWNAIFFWIRRSLSQRSASKENKIICNDLWIMKNKSTMIFPLKMASWGHKETAAIIMSYINHPWKGQRDKTYYYNLQSVKHIRYKSKSWFFFLKKP